VHWDGSALTDRSPALAKDWQDAGFSAAALQLLPDGTPFGLAVANTGHFGTALAPVSAAPDGRPASQVPSLGAGGTWPALPVQTRAPRDAGPLPRTTLVAVALTPDGRGWVAGAPPNAIGLLREPFGLREPAPLLPIAADGSDGGCAGPALDRFTWLAQ